MNILDFIILGLIIFFVIKGIFRGFFREISSLAGIIFGIWIGNHYHPQMANLLKAYIPLEKFLPLISIIILFISVVILFNLFGILLHHLFKRLFIGWFATTCCWLIATRDSREPRDAADHSVLDRGDAG